MSPPRVQLSDVRRARPREWRAYLAARAEALAAFNRGDWPSASKWEVESQRRRGTWGGYDAEPRTAFRLPAEPLAPVDLLVDGLRNERRVASEFALAGLGMTDLAARVFALTLNEPLSWPLLAEWRAWFATMEPGVPWVEPALAEPEPLASAEDARFLSICSNLPETHVFALTFDESSTVEIDLLCEALAVTYRDGLEIVDDLARAGLARHPASVRTRLEAGMGVAELKSLAAGHGVRVRGRKAEIVDAIIEGVPVGALEGIETADYVDLVTPPKTPWVRFRRGFVDVWVSTVIAIFYRDRAFTQFRDAGVGVEITRSDCPACEKFNGRRVLAGRLELTDLPPFHPGCNCSTIPVTG